MEAGIKVLGKAGRICKLGGQGEIKAFGIFPRAVDQVIDPEDGNIVHQQGHDNFIDLPARAQEPATPAQQPPSMKAARNMADNISQWFWIPEKGRPMKRP